MPITTPFFFPSEGSSDNHRELVQTYQKTEISPPIKHCVLPVAHPDTAGNLVNPLLTKPTEHVRTEDQHTC